MRQIRIRRTVAALLVLPAMVAGAVGVTATASEAVATTSTAAHAETSHAAGKHKPTPTTPTTTTTTTGTGAPPPSSCAGTATYAGAAYCVGYIYGVNRTLYGVGTAVVVQSVTVTSVQGNAVTVTGGPSCGPTEWCGQTLPSMSVTFGTDPHLSPGQVVNLYGITFAGGLTPTAYEVVGYCDPDFGC